MNTFQLSLKILNETVNQNIPFALSLRNNFNNICPSGEVKVDTSALTGCVLRHYEVFSYVTKEAGIKEESQAKFVTMMVLANIMFLKRFKDKDILNSFVELTGEEIKAINELILEVSKEDYVLIPKELEHDSNEYLSYRFNTPIWIIKMWRKHYGNKLTYAILKANYRPSPLTVSINKSLFDGDEHEKYPFLEETATKGIYLFKDKFDYKKLSKEDKNIIYPIKRATQYIIDRCEIDPFKGNVAIYANSANNIYLSLLSTFGRMMGIEIITPHNQYAKEVSNNIKNIGAKNVALYVSEAKQIMTCLSNKVTTFFVLPNNSMLDLLRSTPDYFLRIDQQKLDEYINAETLALEEASKQIDLFGNLVYMIPTICKKESRGVIEAFLERHPSFELVEEKQFFPFEEMDSCLYYAILNKRKLDD